MDIFILVLELIGTAAFAVSGALVGIGKRMDIFGVCILGLTTAVGGGIIRDVVLGVTPPAAFTDPVYLIIAIIVSLLCFVPAVRRRFDPGHRFFDLMLFISDSAGLGIFTVCGAGVAVERGFGGNFFLVLFVAVLTGVGGGVLRDIFAGDRPMIFVKHVYACASLCGAVVFMICLNTVGQSVGMLAGFAVVTVMRVLARRFRWSLPKPKD